MIHQFSHADRGKPWFIALHKSITLQVKALREKNDSHKSEIETASLRGQISAFKKILAAMDGKPDPIRSARSNPYQ